MKEAPALFQNFADKSFYRNNGFYNDRDYLEAELISLAKNNKLYITDCINMPPRIRQELGMIFLGQQWTEDENGLDGQVAMNPVNEHTPLPEELEGYKVKLKLINFAMSSDNPNRGKVKISTGMILNRRFRHARALSGIDGNKPVGLYTNTDKEFTGDKNGYFSVGVRDAWNILRQIGARCTYAKREAHQKSRWLVEEVRPS